jgi:protein-disulfide isomerase
MKRLMVTTGAMLLVLACSAPAQQTPAAEGSSTDPAGRIGDRTITVGEVDARWQQINPNTQAQARQALYDGRKAALEDIIAGLLVEQAAKAKGVTPEQFTQDEMSRRVKPVTDADVNAFYESNKERMQGRPLEVMGPAIRQFLEQQRQTAAREALVAELRKAGPPIRTMLDPPRLQIAVNADDPTQGSATAPVTVVEFSDFQCPFCAQAAPTLARIRAVYGDQVRFVWKDFPLTAIHPQAFKAAEAGWCAGEQGKFWNYHDHLFANREALQPDDLKKYAAELKLDTAKFNACLDSSKYGDKVREGVNVGNGLGVNSTPTTFINGRAVSGAQPYAAFAAVIDEELERQKK